MVGRKEDGVGTSCVDVAMILVLVPAFRSAPHLNFETCACCSYVVAYSTTYVNTTIAYAVK
jgi:hypothetical protein